MTRATTKPLTFEEFLEVCPEDGIYEFVDGKILEMEPTRAHQNVARFIAKCLDTEIDRLELGLIVERTAVIRTVTKQGQEQGRRPDVSVISKSLWNEDLSSYSVLKPLQLAVEVASTNWRDDYIDEVIAAPAFARRENDDKLDEYQRLGIFEYWIVDYLPLATAEYIGNNKVPTISVYVLINGQYQVSQFRNTDRIVSPTFPELNLTVEQVVAASMPRKR